MTEENEIKESATSLTNTRTDTPDTHVKSENQNTEVNDGKKDGGDEVKEGDSETKEDSVDGGVVEKQGKDENISGEQDDDKKDESVESTKEKHDGKEMEDGDNEDSKKSDSNEDNSEKNDNENTKELEEGEEKETDNQDTKKSDEDDKEKTDDNAEVDKPDEIIQEKISEEAEVNDHITEEVKEETKPEKSRDTSTENKEVTDPGELMSEKESTIEKQEDVEKDVEHSEVDGSEARTGKSEEEADTTTKDHSEETERTAGKNECLEGDEGEKSSAISPTEGEKVVEESEQKDADEGHNDINKNEGGENKVVGKDEELPEVQPEERPKSDTPKESVDGTTTGDTLKQDGSIERVEDNCEGNTVGKDDVETDEVNQTDGGFEAGGVSGANVERESDDQGKQSKDAGPDEGSKDTGEDQVDAGKSDEPNEEANKEPGVADLGKVNWVEEGEPNEKSEEIEIEKVKESEEGNDPVEDQLTSKSDMADTQPSSSSQKDHVKDPEIQTEHRVRSGTIYRVQTDYLTRQVIAKQEKEIYLEEKLSETSRDLEIAERKVKDLQLRLKRFVKDDEVKDGKMRQMEKEYRDLAEQMQRIEETLDSRSKNNNVGEVSNGSPKLERRKSSSKVCVIL